MCTYSFAANYIESSLIELERSLIELESSVLHHMHLESSLIQLDFNWN